MLRADLLCFRVMPISETLLEDVQFGWLQHQHGPQRAHRTQHSGVCCRIHTTLLECSLECQAPLRLFAQRQDGDQQLAPLSRPQTCQAELQAAAREEDAVIQLQTAPGIAQLLDGAQHDRVGKGSRG